MNYGENNKKMNIGEKVVQIAREVGFTKSDVETAKLEVLQGIAKYGVIILQEEQDIISKDDTAIVKSTYKMMNVDNIDESLKVVSSAQANDVVEAQAKAYEAMLLNTFCITISSKVENREPVVNSFDYSNTVESAVTKAQELKSDDVIDRYNQQNDNTKKVYKDVAYGKNTVSMQSKLAQHLCKEIGNKLIGDVHGERVTPKNLRRIYAKLNAVGWDKEQFMGIICNIMTITYDYEMSDGQAMTIIKHLAKMEKQA